MTPQTLSGIGPTPGVAIQRNATFVASSLLPGVIVILSSGASLTYSVEVTADDPDINGNFTTSGNWTGFDGMTGLATSANGTLTGRVTAIRARITAYTSGTLSFQVVQ